MLRRNIFFSLRAQTYFSSELMSTDLRERGIDYYGVLGLHKGCGPEEIHSAYRRLSKQYNIPVQDGTELHKLFSLISEAYEVLSTAMLRSIYDQYGEEGLKKGVITPFGWHPPYCYHGDPAKTYKAFYGTSNPYADLLEVLRNPPKLFDFAEGKGNKKKEPPIRRPLTLTLEELYHGCHKLAKIQRRVFTDRECTTTEVKEETLTILVKPGTPVRTEICFTEAGDMGHAIIPGDVIFVIEEKPHEVFKRVSDDLLMTSKLSLAEALTGTIITIKTLDERIIRAAVTQVVTPDYKLTVKNEGMPKVEEPEEKGELIISFDVQFPSYLPLESKKLIDKALNEAISGGPRSPDLVFDIVTKDKIAGTVVTPQKVDEKK